MRSVEVKRASEGLGSGNVRDSSRNDWIRRFKARWVEATEIGMLEAIDIFEAGTERSFDTLRTEGKCLSILRIA